jgi:hypothetical protein
MNPVIYNVTIKISWPIHDAWLQWMKEKHIHDLMQTGCFTSYTFARLLDIDEEEGPTYSCQYHATSMAQYDTYISQHSKKMQQDGIEKWGNQFIAFRTLMQVVQ